MSLYTVCTLCTVCKLFTVFTLFRVCSVKSVHYMPHVLTYCIGHICGTGHMKQSRTTGRAKLCSIDTFIYSVLVAFSNQTCNLAKLPCIVRRCDQCTTLRNYNGYQCKMYGCRCGGSIGWYNTMRVRVRDWFLTNHKSKIDCCLGHIMSNNLKLRIQAF